MKRSDKIAGSDFGQPQAGPQGGVQGWTPQIQDKKFPPDFGASRLHPGYLFQEIFLDSLWN
jgi:hypothetical protein